MKERQLAHGRGGEEEMDEGIEKASYSINHSKLSA
jgi:hypothetical protein